MNEKINAGTLGDAERYLLNAISEVRYGSVEVTIHDARIVQVETSEKRRFDGKASA